MYQGLIPFFIVRKREQYGALSCFIIINIQVILHSSQPITKSILPFPSLQKGQNRTTLLDIEKSVFDNSRTQTWWFVVTADMIGQPIKFPDVAEDREIPCDYELIL